MTNHTLAVSALANTLIHTIVFSISAPPLLFEIVLIIGLGTSLLNHSMTNGYAKYGDRLAMAFGLVFDIMVAHAQRSYGALLGLCLSVACYALSKMFNRVGFHILSHIILSCVHANLIL